MKILHVAPYFAPAWAYGGTPRAVYELAAAQVAQGHSVTVVTTDALDSSQRVPLLNENLNGIQVIRIRNVSNWLVYKLHFVSPFKLPDSLKVTEYDVIHLHETRAWLHVQVLRQVRGRAVVFFTPWGTLPYNQRFDWVKRVFDLFLMPLLKRQVVVSFGQNQHEVSLLQTAGIGRQQMVIPLGVELPPVKNRTKSSFRKQFGLKESEPLFLFLGRYSESKGIEVVLRGFAKFRQQTGTGHLLLIGRDDGYLSQMHDLVNSLDIGPWCHIQGPLYGVDRWQAYQAANVFVFCPTVFEETSTACLEALLCGTPVITSYQAEIPFLNEADGVIQIPAEPSALVKALIKWVNNQPIYRPKPKTIQSFFAWKAVADQVTTIYENNI